MKMRCCENGRREENEEERIESRKWKMENGGGDKDARKIAIALSIRVGCKRQEPSERVEDEKRQERTSALIREEKRLEATPMRLLLNYGVETRESRRSRKLTGKKKSERATQRRRELC